MVKSAAQRSHPAGRSAALAEADAQIPEVEHAALVSGDNDLILLDELNTPLGGDS